MSLENQGVKLPPLRGYRRRKTLLDLNVPASETREQEGPSSQAAPPGGVSGTIQEQAGPPEPTPTIDIEAIDDDDDDDDVIVSSPRSFAEAKNNSERARGRPLVVDLDSGRTTRLTQNNRSKRRRVPSNQTIINYDFYINLDGGSSSISTTDAIQPQPQPPKEPTFSCPICMNPFVEETSTKCGHIFCKACIKSAIAVQAKCPTCRKRVVVKDLIRVFLPATSTMY